MPTSSDRRNRILLCLVIVFLVVLGLAFYTYLRDLNKTEYTQEPLVNCTEVSEGNCKDNAGEYSKYCDGTIKYVSFYCSEGKCVSETITCSENQICENGECVEEETIPDEEPIIDQKTTDTQTNNQKITEKHNICNNNNGSCILVEGAGNDECQVDEDCGCICDTGLCCDGCYYRTLNHLCESNFQKEFGCPWGTNCGNNVAIRYKVRYCPGDDTTCTGEISDWQNWSVYSNCTAYQICIDGVPACKYYPYCR